jgi:phospholipid/cholesterol/gamma-HCH transport system permease protein
MKGSVKNRPRYEIRTEGDRGEEITLFFAGRLSLQGMSGLMEAVQKILDELTPSGMIVDLADVEYLDSAGALVLLELENRAQDRSVPVTYMHVSAKISDIMDLLDRRSLRAAPLVVEREDEGALEQIGAWIVHLVEGGMNILSFFGRLLSLLLDSLHRPRTVRWDDVETNLQRAGVRGLPIIGFLSFLMGYIVAIMAVQQLRRFDMTAIVGSVVAVAMIQEFGPIITAILVTGRTGSAFAAEIGTMSVNEEVDALTVIGYQPVRFLVVPKLLSVILVAPILTVYSEILGLLGGLVVGMTELKMSVPAYFASIPQYVSSFDFVVSLLKSVVFAIVIVSICCQRGFETRGGAKGVGATTTSALVTTIFFVIVTDFLFVFILNYAGK